MFCVKCGKTLDPSADFCPDCGTKAVLPEDFESETENAAKITCVPDMQDVEPSPSTGFDLSGAKKVMNGRSILIDDSPLPGTVPAYCAPVPKPVTPSAFTQSPVEQPPVYVSPQSASQAAEPIVTVPVANVNPAAEKKKLDRSILILIVISVVLGLVLAVLMFSIFFGEKLDFKDRVRNANNKNSTDVTQMVSEEEYVSITGTHDETVGILGESVNESRNNQKEENIGAGAEELFTVPKITENIAADSAQTNPQPPADAFPTVSANSIQISDGILTKQ